MPARKQPGPAPRGRAPRRGGARLMLRLDLGAEFRLGPGKVRLLELIGESGSISAAGRAMEMSYRRAWLLVDSMNAAFRDPVVHAARGGKRGGGAELTPFGREVVERYHDMEARATAAVAAHMAALAAALADR
jgi:molybdate transport system regulatory protein